MTQEEKRIKIAEACGWRMVEGMLAFPPLEWIKARIPADVFESLGCVDYTQIPDYFNDLNACSEMEKALGWPETDDYAQNVKAVAAADIGLIPEHLSDFAWINAHPSYRAEAFGITRSLWKEGE